MADHRGPIVPALHELNSRVLESFGLVRGASHTEFIRADDGGWHFLETSARVGGAYIVDVVETASGVNLWREWARVEIAGEDGTYEPPAVQEQCGGSCHLRGRKRQTCLRTTIQRLPSGSASLTMPG